MATRQPDYRIGRRDLNFFRLYDNIFVVHGAPGCPRNACVEEIDGFLRCWACHRPLTDGAARYVRGQFKPTENGAFVVKDRTRK